MPLKISEMSFSFGVNQGGAAAIFVRADLRVEREIVCVLGESGSGKSTLFNLIAGVLKPIAGTIELGHSVVSYLQQDDHLLPFRTTWQNSFLAAELRGLLSDHLIGEGRMLLELFRLIPFSDRLPAELSGGMRRRVALARQLLITADLLLLDEPFAAQDRGMRQMLEEAVHQQCHDRREGALIATHDIDSAVAVADRIVSINSNRQLQETWVCPEEFVSMEPTKRRTQSSFGDHVAETWRRFWEATGRG